MKSGDSLSFSGLVYYVIHLIPFLCLFICLQLKNVSGSVSLSRSKSLSGNPIHLLMLTSFLCLLSSHCPPVLIKPRFTVVPQTQLPRNTFADYL